MAYQPKSYRKFVATAATATLVASAVAPAALAASSFTDVAPKYKEAVDYLFDNGITKGKTEELFGTHQNITRGELAIWLTRAIGLEEEAKEAAASGFADTAGTYYDGYVSVLKEAKILDGLSADEFGVNAFVTRGQMAKLLSNAYGLTSDEKAPFTDMGQWEPFINGLYAYEITTGKTEELFGSAENITRGDLAIFLFRAEGTVPGEGTPEFNYDGEETIAVENGAEFTAPEVTATDAEDGEVEVSSVITDAEGNELEAIDTKVAGTYTITYTAEDADGNVSELVLTVEVAEAVVVAPAVKSVSAIAAKTLKVEFNQAVDTAKASISLKKGSAAVNVSKVTFSEDKKSAELELATKLTKGEYTVTVTGLSEEALTSSVTVENEAVAEIKVLNDKAAISGNNVVVAYQVLNQYGEDITKAASTPALTWTSSKGSATDDNAGVITIAGAAGTFKQGDTVTLTGVEPTSGTVVTKTLTVSDAAVADQITVSSLYNADGEELDTASTFSDFYLLIDAKDQYGNKINAAKFNSDVVVTSSNPSVVNVGTASDNQGPDSDKIGLQLAAPTGSGVEGTSIITIITKATGKVTSYSVTVKKASTVDVFNMTTPTEVVATGETVEIPFAAADQYGKELTSFSALNGNVTLSETGGSLAFTNDYVNKKAVLEYTAPSTAGTYVLMAVTPTGKVTQINVEVKAAAVPTVVAKTQDLVNNFVEGAQGSVDASNFVVQDQYGRDIELDSTFFGTHKLVVTPADGTGDKVAVSTAGGADNEITSTSDAVVLDALAKGSEKFNVEIQTTAGVAVVGSEVDFNTSVIEAKDVTDFVVEDLGTLYDDATAATHNAELKVYGKKADGSKVVIPTSMYTVTTSDANLVYTPGTNGAHGTLNASTVTGFSSTVNTVTKEVQVVIDAANAPVVVKKSLTVTNKAREIGTVEAESTGAITVTGNVVTASAAAVDAISEVFAALEFTDQYGVEFTSTAAIAASDVKAVVTNLSDDDTPATLALSGTNGGAASTLSLTSFDAGDSYNVTFTTSNGKTITLKVIGQ